MYGRDALKRLRQQKTQPKEPERAPSLLEQIPLDAEFDEATLTVWNGERWVSWDKWLATAPIIRDDGPAGEEPEAEERNGETGQAADLPPQSAGVQEGLW